MGALADAYLNELETRYGRGASEPPIVGLARETRPSLTPGNTPVLPQRSARQTVPYASPFMANAGQVITDALSAGAQLAHPIGTDTLTPTQNTVAQLAAPTGLPMIASGIGHLRDSIDHRDDPGRSADEAGAALQDLAIGGLPYALGPLAGLRGGRVPAAVAEAAVPEGRVRLYHGSPASGIADELRPSENGLSGPGIYTSRVRDEATQYGNNVYRYDAPADRFVDAAEFNRLNAVNGNGALTAEQLAQRGYIGVRDGNTHTLFRHPNAGPPSANPDLPMRRGAGADPAGASVAPASPEPAPRLPQNPTRELGRASDGSVLPVRPREPFRQSMVGGSGDLAEAAGMQPQGRFTQDQLLPMRRLDGKPDLTPHRFVFDLGNGETGVIHAWEGNGGLQIVRSDVPPHLQRRGLGQRMYASLLDYADRNGLNGVYSDSNLSEGSRGVYGALQRRGYDVQPHTTLDASTSPYPIDPGQKFYTEFRVSPERAGSDDLRDAALPQRRGAADGPPASPEPNVIEAYHGTRDGAFNPARQGFLPFTHFGTERAALDRVRSVRGRGGKPAVVPVRIAGDGQVIRMTEDTGINHNPRVLINGLVRAGHITPAEQAYISEPFDLIRADRNAGKTPREFYGHSASDEVERRVGEVLSRKGINRIEYQNNVEDRGSTSFIVPDPANVQAAHLVQPGGLFRKPQYEFRGAPPTGQAFGPTGFEAWQARQPDLPPRRGPPPRLPPRRN